MPAITVQVGNEEKEISGLNRKTTCDEVIEALMNDRHVELKDLKEQGQTVPENELENFKNSDLSKLAQNFIIVENWRGCEKPLPPQTRILTVWRAWGKEQCHVKFSLKKDKSGYLRACQHINESQDEYMSSNHGSNQNKLSDSSHYVHKLSHGQKKRIRRSMMQYQRAVSLQRAHDRIDGNNNTGKLTSKHGDLDAGNRSNSSRQKSVAGSKSKITLSEEQFVDGIPECLNRPDTSSKFMRNAMEFNRERCNYRRPHHRRLSLLQDDSDGVTDQNVTLTRSSNDFSSCLHSSKSEKHSRSRSRPKHRSGHRSRASQCQRHRLQGSNKSGSDSTASTPSVSLSSELEHDSYSEGDEADDEISIMADFSTSVSRPKFPGFADSLLPCVETFGSGAVSTNTTVITDTSSATTTCSETSNISGSSFTTSSSETSSGANELELYYARKEAAANAAKSSAAEKPKSGASKLFRIANSFKRKKRTPNSPLSNPTSNKPAQVPSTPNSKLISKQFDKVSAKPECFQEKNSSSTTPTNVVASDTNNDHSEAATTQNCSEEEENALEKLKQLVLSREKILNSEISRVNSIDSQIDWIETQINGWTSKQQENSVVSTSKASSVDNFNSNSDQSFPNSAFTTRTSEWIRGCSDAHTLEEYITMCERIVAKQMQIEEQKRNAEILNQEIQNEVWRTSSDVGSHSKSSSVTSASLGVINAEDDNSSDEDEDKKPDTLSVSSCRTITPSLGSSIVKEDSPEDALELERSRTEMEANLYLGLRLSTELEEVDKLTSNSQQLLQSKGEALLSLVRELAQSDEGISPDLWDEYGELLEAYDDEVALQRYLIARAESDMVKRMFAQNEAAALDESRQKDFLPDTVHNEFIPASTDALQHALSPWLWCDHCKQELERAQKHGGFENTDLASPHWLSHSDIPPNFSSLPLPSPSVIVDPRSTRVPSLLPMLPVPDCNDSDCDDLPDKAVREEISATSTIISTEDSIPRGIVFRHYPSRLMQGHQNPSVSRSTPTVDSLSSSSGNSSSNTDDSGNASAGSTASFASDTMDLGSRNSSCDGGSPKPPSVGTESQDSAHSSPYLFRSRSGVKNKFIFPHSNETKQPSKTDQSKNKNNRLSKPAVAAKPVGLVSSECDSSYLEPSKRLTRSNSGRNKRSARATADIINRRATSFGKGAIKGPNFPNQLTGILKKPFVNGDLTSKSNTIKEAAIINNIKQKEPKKAIAPQTHYASAARTPSKTNPSIRHFSVYADFKNKYNSITKDSYDNDSDTGLSSLHSTDSCDHLNATTGETLV